MVFFLSAANPSGMSKRSGVWQYDMPPMRPTASSAAGSTCSLLLITVSPAYTWTTGEDPEAFPLEGAPGLVRMTWSVRHSNATSDSATCGGADHAGGAGGQAHGVELARSPGSGSLVAMAFRA